MAGLAANPQKSMLKPTALQVVVEFSAYMVGQALALQPQLINQCRVVCFNELVEKCLLGSVAFVVGVTNGILALRQHADRASLR